VIDATLIPLINHHLSKSDFLTQREVAWTINSMTLNGSKQQIQYLVQQGVIEPLRNLLAVKDVQVIEVVLNGLINILQLSDKQCSTIATQIVSSWQAFYT
jgi:hypothetical protein